MGSERREGRLAEKQKVRRFEDVKTLLELFWDRRGGQTNGENEQKKKRQESS